MQKSSPHFLPLLVAIFAAANVALILGSRHLAPPWETVTPPPSASSVSGKKSGEVLPREVPASMVAPEAPAANANAPKPAPEAAPAPPARERKAPEPGVDAKPAPVQAEPKPEAKPAAAERAVQPPAKAPESTPQATPLPLDAARIAAQPQLWPAQVALVVPVQFPIVINGAQAGSVQLPRGTPVFLQKVNADGTVEVQRQGAFAKIPARNTNLLALVQARASAPAADGNASQPAPPAGATTPRASATPGPQTLSVVVSRDQSGDAAGVDDQGNRVQAYRIRIVNPTDRSFPKVLVRFFAFGRTANNELSLAANDSQTCDVGPKTEITVEPAKLRVDKGRNLDGYAVLLRDADNAIVGSQTTRESVAKDWAALENLPPGSVLP